ncbi:unnamed protein product, partial [Rotaria magnacalcarata]
NYASRLKLVENKTNQTTATTTKTGNKAPENVLKCKLSYLLLIITVFFCTNIYGEYWGI